MDNRTLLVVLCTLVYLCCPFLPLGTDNQKRGGPSGDFIAPAMAGFPRFWPCFEGQKQVGCLAWAI
jgi:hypothetical protein